MSLEQISNHFAGLRDLDLVIYQPVLNARRFGEFEIGSLRRELTGVCELLCIPSCYFNGYFPTLSTINGVQTPAQLVSDLAVFHAFDLGISAQDAAHLIYETSYLPTKFYQSNWEQGIRELKEREAQYSVDIGLADFLETNGRKAILMHQFNHPTRAVFNYLGDAICARLDVDGRCTTGHDLDPVCFPVLPSVKKALGINEEGHDILSVNGNTINLFDFVHGSYAAYEKMPDEQREKCGQRLPVLRGHIAKHVSDQNKSASPVRDFIRRLMKKRTS